MTSDSCKTPTEKSLTIRAFGVFSASKKKFLSVQNMGKNDFETNQIFQWNFNLADIS